MLNLNRAQILGNLTRDAELRFTPNGQPVSSFTVATNRRWTGKDGTKGEATEYHDIVLWGQQAETVSPMLKKGGPVYVEGRLQTRSWEGQDGAKRSKTEIVADNVIVLSSRSTAGFSQEPASGPTPANNNTSGQNQENKLAKESANDEINIDEIPF